MVTGETQLRQLNVAPVVARGGLAAEAAAMAEEEAEQGEKRWELYLRQAPGTRLGHWAPHARAPPHHSPRSSSLYR